MKANYEILNNYAKNLLEESKEVLLSPKGTAAEVRDLIILSKMFEYKFSVEHPNWTQLLMNLPLTK
jgi:hypothetical protein